MLDNNLHVAFLKPGEQIKKILHRHWIVFVFKFFLLLGLVLMTVVLFLFYAPLIHVFGQAFFWGMMGIFWMLYLVFIYLSWLNDELDLFVITDNRIIGIEQLSPLARKISESPLDRIQEVDAEQRWLLQTLFNYGTVNIHTASETSNMVVSIAPEPVENARLINNIIQDYRSKRVVSFDTHPKTSENS